MALTRRFINSMNSLVKKIIPENSGLYRFMFFTFMRISAGKRLRKRKLLRFDVHLVDHCNLNCKGCDSLSPIAPKYFLEKESFEKDCVRLAELSGGKLEDICLLGGEPLLHPEITEIMKIARKYFPKTDIGILTNGILLLKMNDDFWNCCRKNSIKITITKYPVKIDIAAIKEKARKASVQLDILYEDGERSFYYKPLNILGQNNIKTNFTKCWYAARCIHLRHGRLSCAIVSYIDILNKFIMGGGGDAAPGNSMSAKATILTSTGRKAWTRYSISLPNPCLSAGTAIFRIFLLAESGRYQKKNYQNGYWSKINGYI